MFWRILRNSDLKDSIDTIGRQPILLQLPHARFHRQVDEGGEAGEGRAHELGYEGEDGERGSHRAWAGASKVCQNVLHFLSNVNKIFMKFWHPRLRSPSVKRAHRLKTNQKSEQKIENMKLRKGKRSPAPQRQLCGNNTTMRNSIDWGIAYSIFQHFSKSTRFSKIL